MASFYCVFVLMSLHSAAFFKLLRFIHCCILSSFAKDESQNQQMIEQIQIWSMNGFTKCNPPFFCPVKNVPSSAFNERWGEWCLIKWFVLYEVYPARGFYPHVRVSVFVPVFMWELVLSQWIVQKQSPMISAELSLWCRVHGAAQAIKMQISRAVWEGDLDWEPTRILTMFCNLFVYHWQSSSTQAVQH